MRHCAWVLFLLALFSHCTGCALREDGKKLMRISKGREPAIAPASQTGKYEVAYLLAGTHHLIHLDGTEVRVAKGQPLGFKHDDARGLVAVGANKEFAIGSYSVLAEYYCWYQRPGHDTMRDVQRFNRDSMKVLSGALVITTQAAAYVGGSILASTFSDEADYSPESSNDREHHDPDKKDAPRTKKN